MSIHRAKDVKIPDAVETVENFFLQGMIKFDVTLLIINLKDQL